MAKKKRRLPPHIVLPDGRWRFVKKSHKIRHKKVVRTIARRKRSYRRYYARARRGYSRRKGLLSGNTGNMVIGAAAGFGSQFIPQFLGGWTNPIVFGAIGYLMKKPALFSIAGYEAGKNLASGGIFGNGSSMNTNGGWL